MNFEEFVKYIEEYESDTFYAKGVELTHEEAVKIAELVLLNITDHHMDGILLSNLLEEVRPETDESESEDSEDEGSEKSG